jgi:D-erythrulose 4-kinase
MLSVSPAESCAQEAASVARAPHGDAGLLLITGNCAGDVMNFDLAVQQLRNEGIDARYLPVTDDIASASPDESAKANAATRTLGVAFDGCTMPGADRRLFTVVPGTMDLLGHSRGTLLSLGSFRR